MKLDVGRPLVRALIAFGIFASTQVAAASSDEDERQAAIAERLGRLDMVTHWHGEYRILRDTYYEGPKGVTALAQTWFDAATQWVADAHRMLATFRAAQDQLGEPEVQRELREKLRQHQDGWFHLRHLADAVRARGDEATKRLAELGTLPVGVVRNYEQGTAFLNDRHAELTNAIERAMRHFDDAQQSQWEQTLGPTAQAATAVLRRAMFVYPELRSQLTYAEQTLAAEVEFHPLVARVTKAYNVFRDHLLGDRIFHAKRALEVIGIERAHVLARIAESSIDPGFRQESIETIERLYASAVAAWARQDSLFDRYQLVARNLAKNERALAADCRDVEKRKLLNCALLRSFIGLKPEKLRKMTEAQLELVEDSIERVKEGPLS